MFVLSHGQTQLKVIFGQGKGWNKNSQKLSAFFFFAFYLFACHFVSPLFPRIKPLLKWTKSKTKLRDNPYLNLFIGMLWSKNINICLVYKVIIRCVIFIFNPTIVFRDHTLYIVYFHYLNRSTVAHRRARVQIPERDDFSE